MVEKVSNMILVGRDDTSEYALQAIVSLRALGENEIVVLKGRGEYISKAIDVYNEVKDRIGDVLELVDVSIGSERAGNRKISYIEIKLKMSF